MAVFSIAAGDPFSYEMDDSPFYDAVSDVSSDVFTFAADSRLRMQTIAYDALTYRTENVWKYLKMGDYPGYDAPMPSVEEWLIFGTAVVLTTALVVAPYIGPWALVTGPVAFALDAYNLYRYFD